jgi:hypothetical protein
MNLPLTPLNYLRVDCHKTSDYSYLRVAVIQIDVHPVRGT